ncbi:MAG: metal-dependent phosphohydrolase [Ferruginibacter sp.]|nr:metal-dependent phosphohydrolase [Ferruginibacter sp.]
MSRLDQKKVIEDCTLQGELSRVNTLKGYLISDFIRQTHAERAREIIDKGEILGGKKNNRIFYRNEDLTVEFANICHSHNEDAARLLDMDKDHLCAPDTYACLPLVGVLLRLADILDFDGKRTPSILFSHLYVRHPVSVKEWQKHRAVGPSQITPEIIQFSAKCGHPAIEASIHEFCDIIDHELSVCNNILTSLNAFNNSHGREIFLRFPFKVDRTKIETQKDIYDKPIYIYRATKFTLSKSQVIDLLMGTQLYGNPEVALRELLQNSIDACLLRQALESKWDNPYKPEISVKYYTEEGKDVLEVIDNGTGMDQDIIDNYYTQVGSSFYTSTDFNNLKIDSNTDMVPSSRFGIGILSCFMVADTMIVDTMKIYAPQKSSDAINMTVEGQDSIFLIKPGERQQVGTSTKLILRKHKNPWQKMSEVEFIKSVETVIPNPPFQINIKTPNQSKIRNENSFKEVLPVSLKDHSWADNENIKLVEIKFGNRSVGIVGTAIMAILESKGMPADIIEIHSKNVEIDMETYSLSKKLENSGDKIVQSSTSITIDELGKIKTSSATTWLAQSKSQISLHGIEVPSDLFPPSWKVKKNQVKLAWPFPLILIVDVCGNRDLDLNSARTEILIGDKWSSFEEELACLIFSSINNSVSAEYWDELMKITNVSNSEDFIRGLKRVSNKVIL